MKLVAQNTDLRASLASATVKKRIRICGRPAVPNISARPSEIAVDRDRSTSVPGCMIAACFGMHLDGLGEQRVEVEAELPQHQRTR